jgi:glutamine phosphoribosylpyrophosphate amidotransferase
VSSLSGSVAMNDTFIRENTKRDLVYIANLAKKKTNNVNLMKRLAGEISVSMPKADEISVFFDEPLIRKIALASTGELRNADTIRSNLSSGQINIHSSESFMEHIRKDLTITDSRREIRNMKNSINNSSTPPEERKKMEESFQQKEQQLEKILLQMTQEVNSVE